MNKLTGRMSRRRWLGALTAGGAASAAWGRAAEPPADGLPPVRAITRGPQFHWRGYYDKLLFDPTDRFVLANQVDFEGRSPTADDTIRVGRVGRETRSAAMLRARGFRVGGGLLLVLFLPATRVRSPRFLRRFPYRFL